MGWTETICKWMVVAAVLSGCTAIAPRGSPLPKDGPNLVDIYRSHQGSEGNSASSARERMPLREVDESALSAAQRRTDLSSVQQRFQRIPNPDLVMHVFPHLARGKYPVPGYVTVFPMYERVEYAMPGEVKPRQAELAVPTKSVPAPGN
jgi:conjugative transfer region lipoprotein (TIGR03751 family)